jgi:hypothetical protein
MDTPSKPFPAHVKQPLTFSDDDRSYQPWSEVVMAENLIHASDPGALARSLVQRLLLDRDLAGPGAPPASPLADDWMLQELCALGRGSEAGRRRCRCWRSWLTDEIGPRPAAH